MNPTVLSDPRNSGVMADEAHRCQYDFIDGYPPDKREKATQTVPEQGSAIRALGGGIASVGRFIELVRSVYRFSIPPMR